jgi:hypothetical protein
MGSPSDRSILGKEPLVAICFLMAPNLIRTISCGDTILHLLGNKPQTV